MRIELEVAGHDVDFVSINKSDGVDTQEEIVKHCSFPQLQDTEALGLWSRMGGGKDDFYILDTDGKLHTYFKFFGDVSTNLSEPEDYQTVKNAILSVLEGKSPGPEPEPDAEPETPDSADAPAPTPDVGPEPDAALDTEGQALDASPAEDTTAEADAAG